MKILSEVKYNGKTRRYQHDVLRAPEIPYVSMKVLEEMFMRLDHQVTQVSIPDYADDVF
jgi:bifunctional DNase/RNase